ncbi:MAG: LamG-like jellyroll fold domain-containing protein, partial [Planctomycetota bacterium]
VKSLDLYFRGDPCNITAASQAGLQYGKLWLELEDTGANIHYVVNNDANILTSADWTVWNVDLNDFNGASVDLSSLEAVRIGVAGTRTDQPGPKDVEGFVYIDDIRLYPPRCFPEISEQTGDFTEDCRVNSYDLEIMATDWLLTDGNNPTGNRPATLTGFPDATSHWVSGYIGTGAIEVNEGYNIDVTDPRLNGLSSMSITAWVKQTIINNWVGIVSSREEVGCGDDATEIGIYGSQYGGPGAGALGYDWSCGNEEWNHDAGLDVPSDGTWTFVAISVDPTGGTLYQRPAGGALQTGTRNLDAHDIQQNFSEGFWIGRSNSSAGYMAGAIDDVRIYTYALDFNDVNDLAYQTADPNPWPVYRYEFDETTGYTAADTGTPTIVYGPVSSIANLTDPEPKLERAVNFRDYAIVADNWLQENLWPF